GVDGYGESLRRVGQCARRRLHRSGGSHSARNRPGAAEGRSGSASDPEAGRLLDPRPADERAEKIWTQEGPSCSPVLQTVTGVRPIAGLSDGRAKRFFTWISCSRAVRWNIAFL